MKTRHPSHQPAADKPAVDTNATWQSTVSRFMTDHQAAILGGGVALLLVLSILFIGQRRQARIVQASEFLGRAETAEQFDEISENFRRTPAAPLALLQAGRIHYKNGAFQQAVERYEQLLAQHSDHPLAPSAELGRLHCYEVMGRLDEALKGFNLFLASYPDHPLRWQAIQGKGRCLETMGRIDDARIVYQDFIALNPDSRWVADAEQALRMLGRLERLAEQEIDIF